MLASSEVKYGDMDCRRDYIVIPGRNTYFNLRLPSYLYVFPERDLILESFYCLSCLRPPPSGEQTSYLAPPSRKVDRILLPYWKSPVYKKEGRKIESYSSTAFTAVRCSAILHVWWRGNAVSNLTDKTENNLKFEYCLIPGGSDQGGNNEFTRDRFCGAAFGPCATPTGNVMQCAAALGPVTTYSKPFIVQGGDSIA